MSDLPPSAAAPRTDEMAEWIVLETTDAKWGDLSERERNRFRRCVRLIVGASRERATALPPTGAAIRAINLAINPDWYDYATAAEREARNDNLRLILEKLLRAAAPQQEERTPPIENYGRDSVRTELP